MRVLVTVAMCVAGIPLAGWAEEPDAIDWPATIAKLQESVTRHPDNAHLRSQLAVAYNNYGVSLGGQRAWDAAIQQLEEAIRLDPSNTQATDNLSKLHLSRAQEAFQRHQLREAKDHVDRALALNDRLGQAYALRGEIAYMSQQLKEAKAAWEEALRLEPWQPDVSKRLEQVTSELPVESEFERLSQAHFDVRYQDALERAVGFDVRDALLEARREVGSDFAYWPNHKWVVLVYSAESFRTLRQETPEWVGGQFDGKIRVPLPNGELDPAMVRQILFHEYTHALVRDLTDGKCPTWLDEGLAEYEGRTQRAGPLTQLSQALAAERLVAWADLSGQFSLSLPEDAVALGYQESYSIVSYLADRNGFWRIRRLLKALAGGTPWEQAFVDEYRVKLSMMEAAWRRWLPEFLEGR